MTEREGLSCVAYLGKGRDASISSKATRLKKGKMAQGSHRQESGSGRWALYLVVLTALGLFAHWAQQRSMLVPGRFWVFE